MSSTPLPDGWIQQHDPHYDHPYWVDTRANPPRAIWVHPYEDEQFLREHPEARAKGETCDVDAPPPYDALTGSSSSQRADASGAVSGETEHKRGVFGRLKDKAIGTKAEREEQKRIRAAQAARAKDEARRARMWELEERGAHMRAHGGYAPYHPSYSARPPPNVGGLGGDNTAALLLGGLAGGLLLGDILGGGF